MILTLPLVAGVTPTLTLRDRQTNAQVGVVRTGVAVEGAPYDYNFDLTSLPDGEYNALLSGVSVPDAPPFVLKKVLSTVYVANEWWEFESAENRLVVLDTETSLGIQIPGVSLRVRKLALEVNTVSDEDGLAEMTLEPGSYSVTATKEGYTFRNPFVIEVL